MAIRARIQAIAGIILVGSCILVKAQMYPFGALMGDTPVNLNGDAQECIDFPNVRIVNPILSGTTSLTDLVTPNGKLCMSPNGGITFDQTVFGSTFTTLPQAPAAHNTAILPLYMDYSTDSHSTDTTAGEFGLFYEVIPCGVDLDAYVTDLANCGLNVAGFNAFWGIKVTWGHLMSPTNIVYWGTTPSPSNTFQVVLLGNALESTYAIINYGRLDVTDYSAAQTFIQGVGANPQLLTPGGDNCGNGRYAFYLSEDPSTAPVCDPAVNCGRYELTNASAPTVSGTCDATGDCICEADYSGPYCLNDDACDCNPNPCDAANSFLCEDTGMVDPAFKCHCNFGFTGATCDTAILECDSSPCEHGGTCTDIPYDFQCACPSNWQGTTCATDVDECAAVNPCLNGGTCNNTDGGFTCMCADGYTGDTCGCEPWGEWSTGCKAASGFDGTCGGCGEQERQRVCPDATADDLVEIRPCNVRACTKAIYREKTERKYVTRDGKTNVIIRDRFCCYKFPSVGDPVKIAKVGGKRCIYVNGGFI